MTDPINMAPLAEVQAPHFLGRIIAIGGVSADGAGGLTLRANLDHVPRDWLFANHPGMAVIPLSVLLELIAKASR